MTDILEFYLGESRTPFLTLRSSFQPNAGDRLSIKGITYTVLGHSFTVDHAGKTEQSVRCNVIVEVAQ